jgi:BirA family transcriptional regulator, biotin operon repressor / biotin---[acetyl-CoA-carboxylase] ligase
VRPLLAPAPAANLVMVGEIDSTNDVAARIIAKWGAEEVEEPLADTVVVAGTQTAGRGRGSNVWRSPLGGLYATWIGWLKTDELTWLPLAAGVALAEAIEAAFPGCALSLQWPNDVVVEGRKLGGILAHSRIAGDAAWAIVGFGVNVEVEPEREASDRIAPVSLHTLGYPGSIGDVRWSIVGGFVRRLRPALVDPADVRSRWAARSIHRQGERMRVRVPDGEIAGEFVGYGPEGQLLLATGSGTRSLAAGELVTPLQD